MPPMLPDRFDATPRKMRDLRPISDLKKLEMSRALGKDIARAFELLGLKGKQIAAVLEMDEAQVSRWIAGTENAPFARLLTDIPGFRGALLVALAESHTGQDIEHQHTIVWKRRA